jgi:hypothetical protein
VIVTVEPAGRLASRVDLRPGKHVEVRDDRGVVLRVTVVAEHEVKVELMTTPGSLDAPA